MPSADAVPSEVIVRQAVPQRAFALAVILLGLTLIAAFAALPFAAEPGPEITAITLAFVAVVLTTKLATSFLVLVHFHEARSWSLLLLGCAGFFTALMAVLHLLTFPGAILPGRSAVDLPQSASWCFVLWMIGYVGLTLAAVLVAALAPQWQIPASVAASHGALGAAVVATSLIACGLWVTQRTGALPALMVGPAQAPLHASIVSTAVGMVVAAILLILLRVGQRDPIFLWLAL